MTTHDTLTSSSSTQRTRLTLGRERLIGVGVVAAATFVLLVCAQVHHWIAPHDSDGAAAEVLPVLLAGALGWLVVFGGALIAPHRAVHSADAAPVSRRYAVGLAVFALPVVVLAYWTPIPWCLGVAALLLVRRARTFAPASRADVAATVMAWIAILGPVLIFVGVLVSALG